MSLPRAGHSLERNPVKTLHLIWTKASINEQKYFWWPMYRLRILMSIEALKFNTPTCIHVDHAERNMKCTCMNNLEFPQAQRKHVVEYLVDFATFSKVQQQTLVIQWINYSDIMRRMLPFGERLNPKVFLLPGTKEMICGHALQRILGYRREEGMHGRL